VPGGDAARATDILGKKVSGLHELRYAIRVLRNSPGFSAVAIASIALAIGANTAMFSFVNGILLRPLPYPESDRIVRVLERLPSGGPNGISTLNYLDWTRQSSAFEYMAAEAGWSATLTGGEEPLLIRGARVSVHYFDIYAGKPALGRMFVPGEDQAGHDRVVLLSYRLWESRFGADPAMLGRDIRLNGEAYTVIGVLPKGGPFDRAVAQIWSPLAFLPANMTRDFRWLGASARLKRGVTIEQARAEMTVIAQRIADAYPDSNKGWGVAVDRLADVMIGPGLRTAVTVLFAATLFVLLIACANLANLTLARGISRQSEMAVRAALGASRWQLVRQLLIENAVISACGGIVGIGIGYALLKWILSLIPPSALPPAIDVGMDTSALVFTICVVVLTGLLGMVPASQVTAPGLVSSLKKGGQGTTTVSPGRRMRSMLVTAEVALAFVMLVASGLLVRSAFNLLEIDPGFDGTNVLTAGLPIHPDQHPDRAELNAYVAAIRAAVEAVPGVRETAITSALPLQGWGYGVPYSIAGRELVVDPVNRRPAFFKIVSPSYFGTLGIKLVAGRALSDNDVAGAPPVALVNETLAKREFPGANPIGQRIVARELVPGTTGLGKEIAWEIVGVIAGEKITGLGDAISAGMYVSNQQSPTYGINFIVRAAVPPQSLQRALRTAIDTVSRDQAFSDVRTLDDIVAQSMLATRVVSTLLAAFASTALLLAAVGIYGVISYSAVRRTQEMGIRAALGANVSTLRMLIVLGGMRLTVIGLAIGLTATFPTTDVLSSMLYGIGPYDPLTIAIVVAVLSGVAAVACFLPAWRITKADPLQALRHH